MIRMAVGGKSRVSPMVDWKLRCAQLQAELSTACQQRDTLEAARSEAEQRFQALVGQSIYAYFELDLEGRVSAPNRRALELFGYGEAEVVGAHFLQFLDPAEHARAEADFRRALQGPIEGPRFYVVRHRHGAPRTMSVNSAALWRNGQPWRVLNLMIDVTQRQEMNRAVRASEAKFRRLFENLPDFVLVVNRAGQVQFANLPDDHFGSSPLRGVAICERLSEAHRPGAEAALAQAFVTGQVQTLEFLDGNGHWWAARIVPMGRPGAAQEAMVICTETTERRQAQAALESERQALRRMLDLYEQHRQLTSYEIHDGIAQPLTMAAMSLESAQQKTGADGCGVANPQCVAALAMLRESLAEARRQMTQLRPSILDDFGAPAAVENLVALNQALQGTTTSIRFIHDLPCGRLAPPLEIAIFRITQEALNNALTHSGSPHVAIRLTQQAARICLEIVDHGRGFDPAAIDPQHVGLEGIRQRAKLLGGQATIDSAPGRGTRISVDLPLLPASPDSDPLDELP